MSKQLVILLTTALFFRTVFFGLVEWKGDRIYPFKDADGYLNAALDFHAGEYLDNGGTHHIRRMPLYPALIAALHAIGIQGDWAIYWWHAGLDLVTVYCIYLFVNYYSNATTGLLAGLLYSVYPLALYRLPLYNTETIQTAAMAIWLLSAVRMLQTKQTVDAFWLSVLTVILVFISPALQLLVFLFLGVIFFYLPRRGAIRLSIWLLIPYLVCTVGWGVRNYAVTGQFFLFDTRGGKEFWLGNNQRYDGLWEGDHQDEWVKEYFDYVTFIELEGKTALDLQKLLYRKGFENILADPTGAVYLFAKKFFRFWYVSASGSMLTLTIPIQTFYLALALWGIWVTGLRRQEVILPLMTIGYLCTIYTLSYSCIRFSLPIMPWVCALGGFGLYRIVSSVDRVSK